ncbi:MAG: MarC family protein, partial [Chryseobacterium sp.]|nr:MarC family protein [Chryseobacterium sp.]
SILQKVFGIILLAISIKLFTANFAQLVQNYINF